MYDPGRRHWQDLLHGLHKASLDRRDHRVVVTFTEDMQHTEIRAAVSHLPQMVKHQVRGKTVIIGSPREFQTWLEGDHRAGQGWLQRMWHAWRAG